MTTLNERLDQAMKLRGMNAPQLAAETDLSKSAIHFVLGGTTRADTIRATTVDRMAAALKVNRDWLLYGTGPMEGVAPGPGVAVSYVKRLDPAIVQPATAMARTMLGKSVTFDPFSDVPLFIAAYELMADATVENRARFDAALTARVLATAEGDKGAERSAHKGRGPAKKSGK